MKYINYINQLYGEGKLDVNNRLLKIENIDSESEKFLSNLNYTKNKEILFCKKNMNL